MSEHLVNLETCVRSYRFSTHRAAAVLISPYFQELFASVGAVQHQLRNSMIPIVTTMGMRLGSMVGSTVLIESLFVIPGLGSVMMNGISNRDFMLVANGVLIISIFVAICNLVVDILYGIIDPRTR